MPDGRRVWTACRDTAASPVLCRAAAFPAEPFPIPAPVWTSAPSSARKLPPVSVPSTTGIFTLRKETVMRLDALVINLNRFGDLLLSQPLLHDLHKAGRSTTLLCLEKYADTEGLLQFASPLLTVPDHLVSPEQADATRHELQAWAENLRATMQADHIINLTPSMPARLLATALAPAPEAVLGFGLDHKGRPRVDGLWPAFLHAAELRQSNAPFNLADMFRMTGAPLLGGLSGRLLSQPGSGLLSELGTEARETARRLLAHAPVIRHGFIGMQLGASEKRRQWPVSHFVELGKRIWQEEGICPVLLGEASERPLADEYARLTSTPFVDVVGQTNIFELGAVLREMAMLVTNNTGTMHLAAGLGLPLLSIFLATAQPCDTGPYLPGSCCLEPTLPCHPCPHDHDCVLGEKCRHHISASIVADLVLAKLTSGQWSEGITTSACREARIWQTATDSRGFITTTCLSDHKADDRTLWLCQQRVYWRRILDDLTSGATEPTPLTNVPLSMACPNYSSQFAARVGKALSHCARLLQTLLQECAPLPESFDPTGHPLCMTILQHMQSCPELASMAFFWHQLCQHYQGRGPRFLQAVRLLHAHILRWAKSFD